MYVCTHTHTFEMITPYIFCVCVRVHVCMCARLHVYAVLATPKQFCTTRDIEIGHRYVHMYVCIQRSSRQFCVLKTALFRDSSHKANLDARLPHCIVLKHSSERRACTTQACDVLQIQFLADDVFPYLWLLRNQIWAHVSCLQQACKYAPCTLGFEEYKHV
jgi:hypothetical protein